MLTLWDIMGAALKAPKARAKRRPPARPAPAPPIQSPPKRQARSAHAAPPGSMAERYETVTRDMLKTYKVRVRKWRSSMSGVAWQVTYRDGTVSRLIEAPRPRGPMSAAVFLHEIGHHAIGFGTYRPRCFEEYHAWKWSLEQMELAGLNVTPSVRKRMHDSVCYALDKARRRGIKRVPRELLEYIATERIPDAMPAPPSVAIPDATSEAAAQPPDITPPSG